MSLPDDDGAFLRSLYLLSALLPAFLLCNGVLKPLFGRVRPCNMVKGQTFLINLPTDGSFPSGHTAAACVLADVLFIKQSRWAAPAAVLAVLMGFSRLYLSVHNPSDVLADAFLGCATALCACRGVEYLLSRPGKARFLQ